MPDIGDRFRTLTEVRPPDLWPEIVQREPRELGPRRPRRLLAAAVAFAVAVAGISFAVYALRRGPEERPKPASTVGNGLIAFEMGDDVYVMNAGGTGVRNLTNTEDVSESAPAWSPDGRRIAFVACRECTTSDIFIMNADGSGVTRVTNDTALDDDPAWSPDGTRIAYHSLRDGNLDIYVVDVDGAGERQLTEHSGSDVHPVWSPDGTRIAFSRTSVPESSSIYVMNADGTAVIRLTDPSLWAVSPVWSPDGTKIAFDVIDLATTTPDVYLMNSDGTAVRGLTDDPPASLRAWSPDGDEILFARLGPRQSLHTLDLATGAITNLYTAPRPQREGTYIHAATWQPVFVATETPAPEQSKPTEAAQAPANPRVTARIPVGTHPKTVAVGAEGVWVALSSADGSCGGSVSRIDPATNEVVATVGLDVGPQDLAVGAGAVWVVGSPCPGGVDAPSVLARVDPTRAEVVVSIVLDGYSPDVVADDMAVWVALDRGTSPSEVVRVDPVSNEVAARIPVDGRVLRQMSVGGGFVWVLDSWNNTPVRIDPVTNEVVRLWSGPFGLLAGEDSVWLADWLSSHDPTVGTGSEVVAVRIDPASLRVVGEPLPMPQFRPIAVTEGEVWFIGGPEPPRGICRLDAETLEVGPCVDYGDLADPSPWPVAFDPGSDTIWVANQRDTVTRIDLR